METAPIIKAEGLTKLYNHQPAVDHLSFQVLEGEIFGFLGPNGAGKSTTLLMLLGLTRPTDGTASVCGLDPNRRAIDVKRLVGYLPENVGYYGDMDAVQTLAFIADMNGMNKNDREDRSTTCSMWWVSLRTPGKK